MAFRIGKSVMLYFGKDLEPQFIFAGLSFLLIIGPLLRWYVRAMTRANFKLLYSYLLEALPFALIFVLSFFVNKSWFDESSKESIALFASIILFIYFHLAFYIFWSGRAVYKVNKRLDKLIRTKSQSALLRWLQMLLAGFVLIWISYVFNLIEDTVPYIVGPIVYSVVIYFLSYKAFKLKVTYLNGDVFDVDDKANLFQQIHKIVMEEKVYLESDVSLASISKRVNSSTQNTSGAINQNAKQNFNDYINYHRIQDAKKLLTDTNAMKYTIASIAFDTGFSSLSSFNQAFKKFEGMTPSQFRNGKAP
ncbi:helix-turn-helix domain-containing protein [Flagellimonas allohymeniacidonis]|uniref:AraC family transcriptional regulator n=1 Tax=Flagellimonas allohymeniacidonis TaxID=2517819 RepID=A0A4Q8QGH2_9FLAO|nr:helix-turn-helix domain-containing protein [Allomuricauda hymeniacidonis]TAI48827.1 AraC family transcriptional regulator [Allomuricauda hymeniacidonis]